MTQSEHHRTEPHPHPAACPSHKTSDSWLQPLEAASKGAKRHDKGQPPSLQSPVLGPASHTNRWNPLLKSSLSACLACHLSERQAFNLLCSSNSSSCLAYLSYAAAGCYYCHPKPVTCFLPIRPSLCVRVDLPRKVSRFQRLATATALPTALLKKPLGLSFLCVRPVGLTALHQRKATKYRQSLNCLAPPSSGSQPPSQLSTFSKHDNCEEKRRHLNALNSELALDKVFYLTEAIITNSQQSLARNCLWLSSSLSLFVRYENCQHKGLRRKKKVGTRLDNPIFALFGPRPRHRWTGQLSEIQYSEIAPIDSAPVRIL